MRFFILILLILSAGNLKAQPGFAFTHMTTDDGLGLASNLVTSMYQDEKGFMWIGTANGLQRFDGSKFIHFSPQKAGSDPMPHTTISQIVPADSGRLLLAMSARREFGLFDPSTFEYINVVVKTATPLPPRAEFWLWKNAAGEIFCTVLKYGILRYNKKRKEFVDDKVFPFPAGYTPNTLGIFEDEVKNQYWFATDSGLCVYDAPTKQMFYRHHNPQNIPLLNNHRLTDRLTQVYIDQQRRTWVFGWPSWGGGGQYKFCFDSTGNFLASDTAGLHADVNAYTEYNHFFETKEGDLWIYGLNVLFVYDKTTKRFRLQKSSDNFNSLNINYEVIYQVLQDKDGSLWFATDKGLYYTAYGASPFTIVNVLFANSASNSFTDVIEYPNGDLWFASWGSGVNTLNKYLKRKKNFVYHTPPPANWTAEKKGAIKLTWSLCRQTSNGRLWVGCNGGVLLIHDTLTRTTQYLQPPEINGSTIRFITEDKAGNIWLGTQGGRLVKWSNNRFTIVKEIGTIIYKIFFDNEGWLWLATHEKGLYAINPHTGIILQHYTAGQPPQGMYSNTGSDIEQLNDSIIVYGAGALNFVNKRTRKVTVFGYEHGLPSNTVKRLRMDKKENLWIITSNGLCRFNWRNMQVNPFGRKDGIIVAEQTSGADYLTADQKLVFTGSNAVLYFDPEYFSTTEAPPNVTITDFKLFNTYIPVDSLRQKDEVKLLHDENSISIYFASLSYRQRDKLTYYYKMEGLDKNWIKADPSLYVNYSLLPPGHYTFKVYCENLDGIKSKEITQLKIFVKPPFWRTWWFTSSLLFVIILLTYAMHDLRVNRLLAVEKIRNRVARDLHDDMGSTLSTINILSSMAKTKIATDTVKTSEYISKISDNSQRMMEAMDDIVWSIKPSNDSMQKIIARMREFATNVLEAKDMDMDFMVDEGIYQIKLDMEARRDLFLIFKEAVNNAAKYSKAGKVKISILLQQKRIVMVVKDDGIGFEVNEADGGNGLGNMKKRADNIHAKISLESKRGEGTTMTLALPLAFRQPL